ncbi:hypothetical protein DPMN_026633 [Dreissena polymorpha]|uniref:Uncharacterized protein n=1 Tax=Dreissena polymorpha TaxID=45954 RepID=A0A9D4LRP3_DREPO|nr:hypothetical protein DPMN_026633 [Dreissena polymorpha]
MARLSRLWTSSSIKIPTKYRPYKSLVVSILLRVLDASQGHKMQCLQRMLCISDMEHKTNNYIWNMTSRLVGLYWRQSNNQYWHGLDTSPGTTLCARLFSRAGYR